MNKNLLLNVLMAGAGGFIGSIARVLLAQCSDISFSPLSFPIGTFIANMCGCALIGAVWGWGVKSKRISGPVLAFLITGLCGGVTTFSTFVLDMLNLINGGCQLTTFVIYSAGSLAAGILMVALGVLCVSNKRLSR